MSIIDRFQRVDAWLASALPQWPASLILLVGLCVGLALALLIWPTQ
jgi:hypothetical protein